MSRTGSAGRKRTVLSLEVLEQRLPLSSVPLEGVGTQPSGGLDGKIVYVHGGHGITAANTGSGSWSFQRPLLLNMVEDLGNKDQMDFLVDYLFRAGATIAALRPIGHQPNEVVLDNDSPGVTFTGAWSNSSSTIYYGSAGDVPYRFATTSLTETATARYRPTITEAGYYPVYCWTRSGSDRATDHLYRVVHSGGATEVTIDHTRIGNGPVYLGTYYFEAGTAGYVEISNRSATAGDVVIADMIRFGNGVGDINRGGGVSGRDREDEAGLYWIQWHVDRSQGVPTSEYRADSTDSTATVGAAPRYAEYMNREAAGVLSDRVFVSFHSNAGSGSNRGVLGLLNGNNTPSSATPNQFLLANTLARQVNDDLVAQNGQYEFNWFDRGATVTLDRSDIEFGEINNGVINNEFDATIIETAFHDNASDAALMRDPKVRDAIARATYQGIVQYFRALDGVTPATNAPGKVGDVRATTGGAGAVTLSWTAPASNTYNGGAATGYRVYTSLNGYGFDAGVDVANPATSVTFTNLDPTKTYYFRIVATNAGGESPLSELVAASPAAGAKVLIVNGFDRLEKSLNPTQTVPGGGLADRVRPRQSNAFDYAVQHAAAIKLARPDLAIETTSNQLIISGAVNLSDYAAVVWILGEESTDNDTFDAVEQTKVTNYLAAGGKLFLSGSEIGWDLDQSNNGRTFYNNSLKADYVSDDANTYLANGAAGSIFAGVSLQFDNGSESTYDVTFPDVITPLGGATSVLTYGGAGGTAGIAHDGGVGGSKLVMLAFPFETILDPADRTDVMTRVLNFFAINSPSADFNDDNIVDAADYTIWRDSLGTNVLAGTQGDADFNGAVNAADYAIWLAQFGTDPASSATVAVASAATSAVAVSPVGLPASNSSTPASRSVTSDEQPSASQFRTRLDWRRFALRKPEALTETDSVPRGCTSEPRELDAALAVWPELMTRTFSSRW